MNTHEHHDHHERHGHNSFTLYVSHDNRNAAVNQVVSALSEGCFCPFELVVLDVEDRPDLAGEEHVVHTPSLVREWPGPRTVLETDLSQRESVRAFLHSLH